MSLVGPKQLRPPSKKTNAEKLERTFIVAPFCDEQCSSERRAKKRSFGFETINAPFLKVHFQPRIGRVAAELVELSAHLSGYRPASRDRQSD